MKKFSKYILKEETGGITIWITLLSVCILSFVMLIIEHIRYVQAESLCMQVGHMSIMSAMADYEPDIYDNYHIFVLDACYGEGIMNVDRLKGNILRYSNESLNPSYIGANNGVKDIMGCSVSKVIIEDTNYLDESNENFIGQIYSYMKGNKDAKEISESMKKYGITEEKYYLYSYILEHFSSYKSLQILGYMNRDYVYEIEYLIYGLDKDNDNMKKIIDILDDSMLDDSKEDVICTYEEYRDVLYTELKKIDDNELCERMKKLIINNINATFDKYIQIDCLITSVDVEIQYGIDQRATKIQLINKWLGKRYMDRKVVYKEKYRY